MNNHYITTKDDLFDPQLVRCVWDDGLDGMRCFAADSLCGLMEHVRSGDQSRRLTLRATEPDEVWTDYPFRTEEGPRLRYAYYDPYYGMKLEYLGGAQIQFINRRLKDDDWHDCDAPCWDTDTYDFRVKPEPEPAWRPFRDLNEMIRWCDSWRGIWLENKDNPEARMLVTGLDFGDGYVEVGRSWYTLENLFDKFTWAGNPVGVKETEE